MEISSQNWMSDMLDIINKSHSSQSSKLIISSQLSKLIWNQLIVVLNQPEVDNDPNYVDSILSQFAQDLFDLKNNPFFTPPENDHKQGDNPFSSLLVDLLWLVDQLESLSTSARENVVDLTIKIMESQVIDQAVMMERLEPEFLEQVQVIQDARAFDKKIIRTKTNMLYKQTKFNLLREESEGYSKLCVELMEHLVQPLDCYWLPDEHGPKAKKGKKHSAENVHGVLKRKRMADIDKKTSLLVQNITSLIGYFDMDPNRVLDIILDAFISQCLDYWDFFIELLKKSPWKPSVDKNGTFKSKTVVGQVFGFKFTMYHSSNTTPVQLFWVAAVLIREGILDLDDLYPHLNPDNNAIREEFMDHLASLSEAASKAGRFAPTKMMGSLDDMGSTTNQAEKETQDSSPNLPVNKKTNQIASLIWALLAVGDLKNGRVLMDRHPTLCQSRPEIAETMCRILHVVLHDVEASLRPLSTFTRKQVPPLENFSPCVSTFNMNSCPIFDTVTMGKTAAPPTYTFFYHQWKAGLPRPSNMATVVKVLRPLLSYIGTYLYRDVLLVGKLIRIGRRHIQESIEEGSEEATKSFWLAILSQYLFPAVSLLPSNPGIANELWAFLKLWPYSVRYALYGEWKHETYEKFPLLAIASQGCRKDIQYIMNRLSKDNIKTYGRHIGKIVHSNPTIAFSYVLNAIECYDNMIPFVVEATRYMTELEFDILCFCLIEALARDSKVRIERNGTTFEKWLKSLSTFCGTLFARYKIQLDGILTYLSNQLISDQVYDLVVFQELIASMSGIVPTEDVTSAQIDGMTGGDTLRREILVSDPHAARKSSSRLIKGLSRTNLIMHFGILVAQHRKEIVFRIGEGEEDPTKIPDLKVLAWLNDLCQKAFLQYFEFLENNAGSEKYANFCPTLEALTCEYGIDYVMGFHIIRPHLSNLVKQSGMETDQKMDDSKLPTPLLDVANQVEKLGLRKDLSLEFFVTFWQLGLSDLQVPVARYEFEIKRKETLLSSLGDEKSSNLSSRKRKEIERIQSTLKELKLELTKQKEFNSKAIERITFEKESWFSPDLPVSEQSIINQILQNCFYPRAIISPGDALYCGHFLNLFHSLNVSNISLLSIYDRILNHGSLQAVVFALTETEAKNFGIFLASCLETSSRWHSDKASYEKEVISGGHQRYLDGDGSQVDLGYEDFRSKMYDWHLRIRTCFLNCLGSGNYMQLRNGMIVLDKISEYFPLIDFMGKELEKSASRIERKEDRGDVKQMARSYYAKLRRRKSNWVQPSKFCENPREITPEAVGSESVADLESSAIEVDADTVMESGEVNNDSEIMQIDEALPSVEDSVAKSVDSGLVELPSRTVVVVEPVVEEKAATEPVKSNSTEIKNISPSKPSDERKSIREADRDRAANDARVNAGRDDFRNRTIARINERTDRNENRNNNRNGRSDRDRPTSDRNERNSRENDRERGDRVQNDARSNEPSQGARDSSRDQRSSNDSRQGRNDSSNDSRQARSDPRDSRPVNDSRQDNSRPTNDSRQDNSRSANDSRQDNSRPTNDSRQDNSRSANDSRQDNSRSANDSRQDNSRDKRSDSRQGNDSQRSSNDTRQGRNDRDSRQGGNDNSRDKRIDSRSGGNDSSRDQRSLNDSRQGRNDPRDSRDQRPSNDSRQGRNDNSRDSRDLRSSNGSRSGGNDSSRDQRSSTDSRQGRNDPRDSRDQRTLNDSRQGGNDTSRGDKRPENSADDKPRVEKSLPDIKDRKGATEENGTSESKEKIEKKPEEAKDDKAEQSKKIDNQNSAPTIPKTKEQMDRLLKERIDQERKNQSAKQVIRDVGEAIGQTPQQTSNDAQSTTNEENSQESRRPRFERPRPKSANSQSAKPNEQEPKKTEESKPDATTAPSSVPAPDKSEAAATITSKNEDSAQTGGERSGQSVNSDSRSRQADGPKPDDGGNGNRNQRNNNFGRNNNSRGYGRKDNRNRDNRDRDDRPQRNNDRDRRNDYRRGDNRPNSSPGHDRRNTSDKRPAEGDRGSDEAKRAKIVR